MNQSSVNWCFLSKVERLDPAELLLNTGTVALGD
jgi:hypothetical protein